MPRTYKRRTDEIEEFADDSLRLQEADSLEAPQERVLFSLEEDEGETLELGDRGRKGFSRLSEYDVYGYRD
jgi:hypothetical protein